ncbi:hypothetical protein [Azospirillum argentinense]
MGERPGATAQRASRTAPWTAPEESPIVCCPASRDAVHKDGEGIWPSFPTPAGST